MKELLRTASGRKKGLTDLNPLQAVLSLLCGGTISLHRPRTIRDSERPRVSAVVCEIHCWQWHRYSMSPERCLKEGGVI